MFSFYENTGKQMEKKRFLPTNIYIRNFLETETHA